MLSRRLIVPFIVAILVACRTADAPPPAPPSPAADQAQPIPPPNAGLVAFGPDGSLWLMRSRASDLEKWEAGASAPALRLKVGDPPLAMRAAADRVVMIGTLGSTVILPDGRELLEPGARDVRDGETLIVIGGGLVFSSAAGEAASPIPGAVTGARLLGPGRAIASARDEQGESLYLAVAGSAATRIAGPFASVQSFDASPDATEVAFSASRGAGLDIGLVSSEGSAVRWIGPDPLVERSVKWAPRGNKIAFVIETPGGAVVRSVHIPTGFQVATPLPLTGVIDLAWDREAEHLALLLTSADAGERVEVIRYDGTERRVVVPPAFRAEAPDQLAGVPEAVLFPPDRIRYNEKVPLVIWATEEGAFAWHGARAALQQNRSMGSVVVAREAASRPALWEAMAALPWVDPARVFLVAPDVPALPRDVGFPLTVLTPGTPRSTVSERITRVGSESMPLEEFALGWLKDRLREFEREHDGN